MYKLLLHSFKILDGFERWNFNSKLKIFKYKCQRCPFKVVILWAVLYIGYIVLLFAYTILPIQYIVNMLNTF